MKKIVCIILTLATVFTLFACDGGASVTLDKTSAELKIGDSIVLDATTTSSSIVWSSDNEDTVTVQPVENTNKAIISAISEGVAKITAKVGNSTATCQITVTKKDSGSNPGGTENPDGGNENPDDGGNENPSGTENPDGGNDSGSDELESLVGKKFSILGDSISTLIGISNSPTVNNTLANNAVWYGDPGNEGTWYGQPLLESELWWGQLVTETQMELLVNNSWSGSCVSANRNGMLGASSAGYNTRCLNLHDNTLSNNPNNAVINPEVIAVFMGTNDYVDGVPCNTVFNSSFWTRVEASNYVPTTFDEAYAVMLYKITSNYSNAHVFTATLPKSNRTDNETLRTAYNNAIKAISEHYGCKVADLGNSALSNYNANTLEGLHPNREGMDIITNAFFAVMNGENE